MISFYIRTFFCIALLVILSTHQIFCKSIGGSEEDNAISRQAAGESEWNRQGVEIPNAFFDDAVTTKRPQIGEILGQGLQGILQGIVKAPSDIASRVQEILDGILRRPTTAVPVIQINLPKRP